MKGCQETDNLFLCESVGNLKTIVTFAVPFIGSGGGIGRHAGLKIPWAAMPVRVRFPSRAPMKKPCGNSSVGRAQPCQGWGREFEPRFPLYKASEKSGAFFFYIPFISASNLLYLSITFLLVTINN